MNFQLLLWDPVDTNLDFLQRVVMEQAPLTSLFPSFLVAFLDYIQLQTWQYWPKKLRPII